MSWLSNLVEGKRVIREWDAIDKQLNLGQFNQLKDIDAYGAIKDWGERGAAPWVRDFRRNVEFPWKSGYRVGSESYGTLGGILGGVARVATDWFFQTGPGSGDNPAWSTEPGAEVVMTDEEKNNAG